MAASGTGRSNGKAKGGAKAKGSGRAAGSGKSNSKSNGKSSAKPRTAKKPAPRGKSADDRAADTSTVRSGRKATGVQRVDAQRRVSERLSSLAGRPSRDGSNTFGRAKGTLIIIGGHEDKEGDKLILRLLADRVGASGKLVVATVASAVPGEMWEQYEPLFRSFGIRHVHHLTVESRDEAKTEAKLKILDDATAVFFTGGDQLKLTSLLGDTPIYERLREIYLEGGIVAGTSAGASVVCETMLVSGSSKGSTRIGATVAMAPGFGLLSGVIIDQHFAERGRIGRLISAVAQNPRILGIGIDENTAIVCSPKHCFEVIGEGAVYVLDAQDVSYTNLTDESSDRTLSTFGIRLHVLSMGDELDMTTRLPSHRPAEEVEEEILEQAGD